MSNTPDHTMELSINNSQKEQANIDFSLIQLLPNGKVEARNLWKFLESKQEFSNWIKNLIEEYQFSESSDFDKIIKPHENNKTDYQLSVDCAKEICMVSRTDKGREARRYFIECEKRSKDNQLPSSYIQALEELVSKEKQRLALEAKIEEDKPKLEFANQLLDTTNAIEFSTACKAMHLDYGRNTLFAKCREMHILRYNNEPYQEYVDRGYFVVLENSYNHPVTLDRIITTKTLITARGQSWLIRKLKNI